MSQDSNGASYELGLATEEDVKARVILPWLTQLGFAPSELTFETKFTVTVGRDFGLTIGEDRTPDKRAYADIVCYRGAEPLMVVEVKKDDVPLGDREREQAISYARLLPRIAPFAVVANSTTIHVYDVVTREELSHAADSAYARDGLAIELDSEIRAMAARALVTFAPATLLDLCAQQHRFYLAPLVGSPEQDRVYSPDLFEPREGTDELVAAFWVSSSRCLAVIGPSGVGKTSLLCWLTESESKTRPAFFYDARMLVGGIADALVNDFAWLVGRDATAEQVLGRLSDLSRQLGTEFLIVIDAADERTEQEAMVIELDQLLRRTDGWSIRFALAVKSSEWPRFLTLRGTPTAFYSHCFGELPPEVAVEMREMLGARAARVPGMYIPPLSNDELERAWSRYRRIYAVGGVLAGELRDHARLPFSMRMVAEAYAGANQLPLQWADYALLDRWLEKRLVRLSDHGPARRAAAHLSAAMIARDDNVLPEGAAVETLVTQGFLQPEHMLRELVRTGIVLRTEVHDPGSLFRTTRVAFPHDRLLLYLYCFAERRWHELPFRDQRAELIRAESGGRMSRTASIFFVEVLLDDWSRSGRIGEHVNDLPSLTQELHQPLGLVKAVRQAALSLVETQSSAEPWLSLLRGFASAGLSPRWRQAVLLAPLGSSVGLDLLERLTPVLLASKAALLRELISAALTLEVWPDVRLLSAAAQVARRPSEIPALLYQEPLPNFASWSTLMSWLVPRLDSLPDDCRAECADAMLLWQRGTPPAAPFRKEIGRRAAEWLAPLDKWRFRRLDNRDDEEFDP